MSASPRALTFDPAPGRRHRRSPSDPAAGFDRDQIGYRSPESTFVVQLKVVRGVAVLKCTGELDASAVTACRDVLNAVLRIRAARIVLDLEDAQVGEPSIPLLAEIARIAARHGVIVDVAMLPLALRPALIRAAPAKIRPFANVHVALQAGLTDPPRPPGPRPSDWVAGTR